MVGILAENNNTLLTKSLKNIHKLSLKTANFELFTWHLEQGWKGVCPRMIPSINYIIYSIWGLWTCLGISVDWYMSLWMRVPSDWHSQTVLMSKYREVPVNPCENSHFHSTHANTIYKTLYIGQFHCDLDRNTVIGEFSWRDPNLLRKNHSQLLLFYFPQQ